MFLVTLTYIRPIEEIEAKTAEHREWLNQHLDSGLLILAGPMVPRTGGVLIARGGGTKDELAAILRNDPFQIHGLADYAVTEFKAIKFNPALEGVLGG